MKHPNGTYVKISVSRLLRNIPLLSVLFLPCSAIAQHWMQLKTPPGIGQYGLDCPFFLNSDTGFIYESGLDFVSLSLPYPSDTGFTRTTDGGKTWTNIYFSNSSPAITQIYFTDQKHGFATATGKDSGLYATSNAGQTWNKLTTPISNLGSVYAKGNCLFTTAITGSVLSGLYLYDGGGLYVSSDSGVTWNQIVQAGKINLKTAQFQTVTGNDDSLVATVCFVGATSTTPGTAYLVYSLDLGKNWLSVNLGTRVWGVMTLYIPQRSCHIIREDVTYSEIGSDTYSFLLSDASSGFIAWDTVLSHKETGAFIAGKGCTLYVSDAFGAFIGGQSGAPQLYRSTDGGFTWTVDSSNVVPSFTEIDDDDHRNLSVVGNGATVFATDTGGKLWKTIDGGDGALAGGVPGPEIMLERKPFASGGDTLVIPPCKDDSIVGFYQSLACDYAQLDSVWLTGLDTSEFTQISTHHSSLCDALADTTKFLIVPKQTGVRSLALHTRFTAAENQEIDSTIQLTLKTTIPPGDVLSSPAEIGLGQNNTCSTHDTTFTIANFGCFPLTLKSIQLSQGGAFSLPGDSLPRTLNLGDSTQFRIHFGTNAIGSFYDTIVMVATIGDSTYQDTTLLTASTTSTTTFAITNDSLHAGNQSFCTGDTSVSTHIFSSGCDTLVISNVQLASDGSFKLVASPMDSLLLPGDSSLFELGFSPRIKGEHQARLSLHLRFLRSSDPGWDTSIVIDGVGLPGTRYISASPSSVDLDSMYECQARDTIVTVENYGCDTLHITGISFSSQSYSTNLQFPDTLAPRGTLVIPVHVDTTFSNGAQTIAGTLTLESDAMDSIGPISFTLTIIPPVHLILELLPPDSGLAGDTVTYVIRVVGPHPPQLFSAFQFDIAHDDDLLGYIGLSGNGLSVVIDKPTNGLTIQHYTLLPVPLADTIGFLKFVAYVSKNKSTSLLLSKFNTLSTLSISEDCIASLADSGTSFTFIDQCGDPLLRDVLTGTPIIVDLVPNPAKEKITVNILGFPTGDGPNGSEVKFQIFDMLGREVTNEPATYDTNRRSATLNVVSLTGGVYYLRVSCDSHSVTKRLVIVR